MPTPVSNSSAPVPTAQPDATPIAAPPPQPRVVTIDPVYIEGDAGRQELLRRHAAAKAAPLCVQQTKEAVKGGVNVGLAFGGALVAAATGPLGFAVGLGVLFMTSEEEGERLRHLYDCKKP